MLRATMLSLALVTTLGTPPARAQAPSQPPPAAPAPQPYPYQGPPPPQYPPYGGAQPGPAPQPYPPPQQQPQPYPQQQPYPQPYPQQQPYSPQPYPQQPYPQQPQPYPPQPQPYQAQPWTPPQPQAPVLGATAAPATPPGYHKHDGFFLRLNVGAVYGAVKEENVRMKLSGAGSSAMLSIGYSINEQLALHLDSFAEMLPSPSGSGPGGELYSSAYEAFMMRGIGGGGTYYVSDNYLATASVYASKGYASPKDGGDVADTKWGYGFALGVGREWWVSDNWGLGALLRFAASAFDDDGGLEYATNSLSLVFSATYN